MEPKDDSSHYRIGDDLELMKLRQRTAEMARKIKGGPISKEERDEYLKLLDLLAGRNK